MTKDHLGLNLGLGGLDLRLGGLDLGLDVVLTSGLNLFYANYSKEFITCCLHLVLMTFGGAVMALKSWRFWHIPVTPGQAKQCISIYTRI